MAVTLTMLTGQLRFGPEHRQYGDPFDGQLNIENRRDGICLLSGLDGTIDRFWHDALLEFIAAPMMIPGYVAALEQRRGGWFQYPLLERPFRRARV